MSFRNIDVRIRAAEMEYELEREELNILNLREEIGVLHCRLHETVSSSPPPDTYALDNNANRSFNNTAPSTSCSPLPPNSSAVESPKPSVSIPAASGEVQLVVSFHAQLTGECAGEDTCLVAVSVHNNLGNTPFHLTTRPPPNTACVVDWATDDTRLKKGDK